MMHGRKDYLSQQSALATLPCLKRRYVDGSRNLRVQSISQPPNRKFDARKSICRVSTAVNAIIRALHLDERASRRQHSLAGPRSFKIFPGSRKSNDRFVGGTMEETRQNQCFALQERQNEQVCKGAAKHFL
ncbi:hypothetical protein ONS96_014388 [Cadophora gregata f. sp. sojae]|nr:hypothetical protein ONS96_014388 [Cadophora gregata f. sp. sojae]